MSAMVEKLDAQIAIDGQHPVACFVHLVQQRPFVGGQTQGYHRPAVGQALAPGESGGGHRQQARGCAEQVGQFLGVGQRPGDAV